MWRLMGGVFLGWGLDSNDSVNIFSLWVAVNVIKYKTVMILISVLLIIDALLEGYKNMDTVGEMWTMTNSTAFIETLASGLCMATF